VQQIILVLSLGYASRCRDAAWLPTAKGEGKWWLRLRDLERLGGVNVRSRGMRHGCQRQGGEGKHQLGPRDLEGPYRANVRSTPCMAAKKTGG
jgi:hypothetical protein